MQPTPGDVHVNAPLTNISVAFLQSRDDFIATRVFPNIPVQKQSDRYFVFDRHDFNRDEMALRAPSTESVGGGYSIDSTPTYFCNEWAFHKDIPDQVRNNADAALNPDREATHFVTHKALIRREKLFVDAYFKPGVWATDIAGVNASPGAGQVLRWNDANSDPIKNVRDAKRAMRESTGFEPNKLVLGRAVYDALVDHPDIIDRVKYGQTAGAPARGTLNVLAQLLEIDELLVMNAIESAPKEGQPGAGSFIGGKHALLVHAATAPGLMTPSAGYTFSWVGQIGAAEDGLRIRQFRMEQLKSDRVEIEMCLDMKKVAADLGYFFNGVVA
ncbi:major capsid protein [Rubellimicrobium sp. CFH 75288]|uniref:major capsid protein n=1 Tax=Rubellimicrobium sp. CFH 75288 TaxID=2697034 RepID=UPI001412135C|nr:major capsid protein [Rubellimicrobium sp. CFH 75288]NAZ37154.1 hypothetical protein [Rubellimicrobium sp. CFH 75288]